mgnify:CR=1 FL=1
MENSILNSTKKALGIAEDYVAFDPEIVMHINSTFSTLQQLGVGRANGFFVTDKEATWAHYGLADDNILNSVRTYVYLKVRLLWDPPTTSFAIAAMEKQAQEFEWRLHVHMEGVRHPW